MPCFIGILLLLLMLSWVRAGIDIKSQEVIQHNGTVEIVVFFVLCIKCTVLKKLRFSYDLRSIVEKCENGRKIYFRSVTLLVPKFQLAGRAFLHFYPATHKTGSDW